MLMSIDVGDTLPPEHPWSPYCAEGAANPDANLRLLDRLREQHVGQLRRQKYLKPSALMRSIKAFDHATFRHCVRVSKLALSVGERMRLEPHELRVLERAALLHDAGKLCVPGTVLNKAGALDEREWELIKQHPAAGETIGFEATSDPEIARLIRSHHERLDGTGYPDCLTDADIPIPVRVLQIADIYDALTSERSYKVAFPKAHALATIGQEVDCGWRDPDVFDALVSSIS